MGFNLGRFGSSPYSWNSLRETNYLAFRPVLLKSSTDLDRMCLTWNTDSHIVRRRVREECFNRRLIELACGRNSALGRYTEASKGCDRVRFTADDDLFWRSTHLRILGAASSQNVVIWISLPYNERWALNVYDRRTDGSNRKRDIHRLNWWHLMSCVAFSGIAHLPPKRAFLPCRRLRPREWREFLTHVLAIPRDERLTLPTTSASLQHNWPRGLSLYSGLLCPNRPS